MDMPGSWQWTGQVYGQGYGWNYGRDYRWGYALGYGRDYVWGFGLVYGWGYGRGYGCAYGRGYVWGYERVVEDVPNMSQHRSRDHVITKRGRYMKATKERVGKRKKGRDTGC